MEYKNTIIQEKEKGTSTSYSYSASAVIVPHGETETVEIGYTFSISRWSKKRQKSDFEEAKLSGKNEALSNLKNKIDSLTAAVV